MGICSAIPALNALDSHLFWVQIAHSNQLVPNHFLGPEGYLARHGDGRKAITFR